VDEHESANERRAGHRRNNDIEDITEVKLLRHEVTTLKERLEREEADDHKRLLALEKEVAEFRRKFNFGKGVFYGGVAILGTTGVYLVDHMKELMERLMK